MLRRTPVLAVVLSLAITFIGIAPSHAVAPDVTAITVSDPVIYPAIVSYERPGSTMITMRTGASSSAIDYVDIRDGDNTMVKRFFPAGYPAESWDGRDAAGNLVPAGSYTIVALNSDGEEASMTGTVAVSHQHLIPRTYVTTRAANRYAYKFVGRCSTLHKPSRRGWRGSLGYYSNTKCKSQTWKASRVITIHQTRLPAAEQWGDVRVDVYGGAARAKPRSRAAIEYIDLSGYLVGGRFLSSKVGWHSARSTVNMGMVDPNGWFAWRLSTAFKAQDDVKQFRIVVHYYLLSSS